MFTVHSVELVSHLCSLGKTFHTSTYCALDKSVTDKHLVHFHHSYLRTMILVCFSPLTTDDIGMHHIIANYFPKPFLFQSSLLFEDNIKK